MSNKNVRRLSGNAFRMQKTLCAVAIGLGILLAFSTDASATRGRVKIKGNSIVTDRGTLIRGARVSLDIWDETPTQADVTTIKNSRGLNAFHIYAEYPGSNQKAGYNVKKVDKVVDMADSNGLYVVLTIGSGGENGRFHQDFVTAFWDFYAPRYKDRTHVVYEVCNEPQAWEAPYNSATLKMEKDGHDQIRKLAPDTHIMMMTYANVSNPDTGSKQCENLGISWDNTSVAFHTYGIAKKEDQMLTAFFTAMKAKGIVTSSTEPDPGIDSITTRIFEREGISRTYFINVHSIATDTKSFYDWVNKNKITWAPDFGAWPLPAAPTNIIHGSIRGGTAINFVYPIRRFNCLGKPISETSDISTGFYIFKSKSNTWGMVNFDKFRTETDR